MKYFFAIAFSFLFSIPLFSQSSKDEARLDMLDISINGISKQQADTVRLIRNYLSSIHKIESEWIDSTTFQMDSVNISIKKSAVMVYAVCSFGKEYLPVKLRMYYRDGQITYAQVTETSKTSDLQSYSAFYYSNDRIIYRDYMSTVRACMVGGGASDKGYNTAITTEFLEKFITMLMEKAHKKKHHLRTH